MKQALRPNAARAQTARSASIPAPTGGWDAQNSLADMPASNAVILDNFIPRAGYVELRRGYVPQATGLAYPVVSLLPFRGAGPGKDKLFAAAATGAGAAAIYDASTAGAALASVYTGLTNPVLKCTDFANDAGRFTIAVNGSDTPIHYDGTSWSALAITTASGQTPALNPANLVDVMESQERLFFIEAGTLHVWFLAVQAIQGQASLLDLGMVFPKGGTLICMGVWTLNSGDGPNSYTVFMTSEGQVAVYEGTDPSQAASWSLVGTFDVGLPLSRRSLIRYGSDLAVVKTDGVLPLTQAMSTNRAADNLVASPSKIHDAFQDAARATGPLGTAAFGWEAILYPGGSLGLVNVPQTDGSFQQFVQNMQTGAWCRFLDLPARCWAIANENIYFGGPDGVYEWDVGSDDAGDFITGDIKTAFQAFDLPGRTKTFTMVRPLMKASAAVQPTLVVTTDYQELVPSAPATIIDPGAITPADANAIRYAWQGATGEGFVAAARLRVSLRGDATVYQIATGDGSDILIDNGDYICERLGMPFDIPVQVIGFDLQFKLGALL